MAKEIILGKFCVSLPECTEAKQIDAMNFQKSFFNSVFGKFISLIAHTIWNAKPTYREAAKSSRGCFKVKFEECEVVLFCEKNNNHANDLIEFISSQTKEVPEVKSYNKNEMDICTYESKSSEYFNIISWIEKDSYLLSVSFEGEPEFFENAKKRHATILDGTYFREGYDKTDQT